MPVEAAVDGRPPPVVKLPQTGLYIAASDAAASAVEHVYVLADRLDGTEVYRYQQPASETAD